MEYSYLAYIRNKPKKWKCVEKGIYSNNVYVKSIVENTRFEHPKNLGNLELKYKMNSHTDIDETYLTDFFIEHFGEVLFFDKADFERDRGIRTFILAIYMTEEQYMQYIRKLKFERICK